MRNNLDIALISHECEGAIGDEKDTVEMLRKSFAAAKNHWMVLDQDQQLRGALNAVLVKMGDRHQDRQRLETEIRMLGQFNAFIAAASAGLNVSPPELPNDYEAIGIMKLWREKEE